MLVQFSFFGAYFTGSVVYFIISSIYGDPIVKIGYKKGIIAGLIVSAIGCILFFPAASIAVYGLFLAALFVLGIGFTLLQIAANPYVAALGKPETAGSRLNLSQGFNSFGTTIAPIVGGYFVFHYFAKLGQPLLNQAGVQITTDAGQTLSALGVQLPYLIFAAIFLIMALVFAFTKLPRLIENNEIQKGSGALAHKQLVYGMIAIFFYVGAEVVSVDTLINYGISLGFDTKVAKFFSSFTLVAMLAGYVVGIITIPKYLSQQKALRYFALLGVLFTFLAVVTKGYVSVMFVVALGFANSIMWPAIWPLAIDGLGRFIKKGSALLVMAIAGGALIPLAYGYLSGLDSIGSKQAYWILVPCYLFILFLLAYFFNPFPVFPQIGCTCSGSRTNIDPRVI